MIRIPKSSKKKTSEESEYSDEPRSEKLVRHRESDDVEECFDDDGKSSEKQDNPALSAAYRILQSGANSRKMLRDKLVKKGFSLTEANYAIALCESQGLLSEKRLLLSHTEYLARKKHYGRSRIYRELLKKFDRESVVSYFDEAIAELDFTELAKAEAERVSYRGKRYVLSRLSSLGYSSHEIYEALDGLIFETESFDT